jgi:hypothetical protein
MRPDGCKTPPRYSAAFPANSTRLPSSSPPRPIGGAVSVAARDAVVDTKGEPNGHHQIEVETS